MPRVSATPRGTWALSQSEAWRPQMIRSKPPSLLMAAVSNCTVKNESTELAKASSCSSTNSSAPMDSGFFITSRANVVPEEITVMLAPCSSLICRAASTAFSSKPFTTGGMFAGGTTCRASGSIRKAAAGISGSTTCLASTQILTGIRKALSCGDTKMGYVKVITSPFQCQTFAEFVAITTLSGQTCGSSPWPFPIPRAIGYRD